MKSRKENKERRNDMIDLVLDALKDTSQVKEVSTLINREIKVYILSRARVAMYSDNTLLFMQSYGLG